ncbi:MAG: fibronectin type III domain-containing protein, partial [Clostridiales bacterium]|nr:fibronectin type III domain-containing protein [Clostridiales bacterium]
MKRMDKFVAWVCVIALLTGGFPRVALAAPGDVLSAPQNLAVTEASSYSVTLSWDAPAAVYDGGGDVTYRVSYAKAQGQVETKDVPVGVTSFECKYLDYDTRYDFKVYAAQGGAVSPPAKLSYYTHEP